ncbi:MAG: hypothetical protein HY799_03025 [Nitrosomonadales bacterium]|nr:hypothetical protein [Nitrosomonadales bacterium]
MHSRDFLQKDANELELEIERHCIGLGLDCSDEYQVRLFAHEMLQNMEQLKDAANKGDRSARAKVELFGMVLMMHQANSKAFGSSYMTQFDGLSTKEPAWTALAKALGSELESRNLDEE